MSKKVNKYNRYLFASILLIVGIASANAESVKPRHMQLNAIDDSPYADLNPRGNVTINQQGNVFNYTVSKLGTLDIVWTNDGMQIYSIYMWTPTLGKLRIQNFNTSLGGTHSSVLAFADEQLVTAITTDPLCVEVWYERDDGLDGPDIGDNAVLRGETEEGACASIK